MLLAAPPSPLPSTVFTLPARTSRPRPKLSLQVNSVSIAASLPSALRTPLSAVSPTTRNTRLNRTLTAPSPLFSPAFSSPSSSSSDEAQRQRQRQRQSTRKKMSAHQPSTPSASFMPRTPRTPRGSGRVRGRARVQKRVGFVDEVVVHVLPFAREEPEELPAAATAVERSREIERLREWVHEQGRNSPGGGLSEEEGKEWVRKLVELEMGDVDMS